MMNTMPVFYFAGDSITASNRLWMPGGDGLGDGYVSLLAAQLRKRFPEAVFCNRGFDGFSVAALLRHLRRDTAWETADFITVQIGINNVGIAMNTGVFLEAQDFPGQYKELLSTLVRRTCSFSDTAPGRVPARRSVSADIPSESSSAPQPCTPDFSKAVPGRAPAQRSVSADIPSESSSAPRPCTPDFSKAVPGRAPARILAVGPFLFPQPQEYAGWMPVVAQAETIMAETAAEAGVPFLPVQESLNTAARRQGYSAITTDGIHLTPAGHRLLAQLLLPHYDV